MTLARVVVAFLLLILPSLAAAEAFSPAKYLLPFDYNNYNEYGLAYADERPGGRFTLLEEYPGGGAGAVGGYKIIGGQIAMESGAFVRETEYIPYPDWDPDYTVRGAAYAAGGTVDASWIVELPEGGTRVIDFTATLGAFEVFYTDDNEPAWGEAVVPFTRWRTSRDDAAFLGLASNRGTSGDWNLFLDYWPDYLGGGDDEDVQGFYSYGHFEATPTVPEPGIALLVLAGLGASLRRWQRGRRASGRIAATDRTGSPID